MKANNVELQKSNVNLLVHLVFLPLHPLLLKGPLSSHLGMPRMKERREKQKQNKNKTTTQSVSYKFNHQDRARTLAANYYNNGRQGKRPQYPSPEQWSQVIPPTRGRRPRRTSGGRTASLTDEPQQRDSSH